MNNNHITLLLANYNNGEYLEECMNSILNQTSNRWNVLIVDDKSTDNSSEIYKKYENNDNIEIIFNEQNLGYIGSLKKLIDASPSDIVGILDPDDKLELDCIEKVMDYYDKHIDAGFVYTNFWFCDENMNKTNKGFCKKIPEGKTNLDMNKVSHLKTFKKSVYYKTEGYDELIKYAEDKDLVFKMEEVTKLHFINECLYLYRKLPQSQSNGAKSRQSYRSFKLAERLARKRRGIPTLKDKVIDFINKLKK